VSCTDRQTNMAFHCMSVVVVITSANTRDMKAAKDTLDRVIVQRPSCKQNLCMSYKAYDFLEIEGEANKRRYIIHIPHKGEEERIKNIIHTTTIKRWVVERTISWHNRFRKLLLIRYEKKSTNYLAIVQLACCLILYRRIILG
jgi:putative transposase